MESEAGGKFSVQPCTPNTFFPPEMFLGGLYLKPSMKESPLQLLGERGEKFKEPEIRPF